MRVLKGLLKELEGLWMGVEWYRTGLVGLWNGEGLQNYVKKALEGVRMVLEGIRRR